MSVFPTGDASEKYRLIISESVGDPYFEIALEESILREINEGKSAPALRFWRCGESVVMGASRRVGEDVLLENVIADGIPLIRRTSGGGTVYHHPENFCYSMYLPYVKPELGPMKNIRESIQLLCGIVAKALKYKGFSADINNRSDIRIDGRKISGTAQQRLVKAMCHHGTILLRGHVGKIERYLAVPKERSSPHSGFMTDLQTMGYNGDMRDIAISITQAASEVLNIGYNEGVLTEEEKSRAEELVVEKYRKESWTYRFK